MDRRPDFFRSRAGTTHCGGARLARGWQGAGWQGKDGLPKCECGPADLTTIGNLNDASPQGNLKPHCHGTIRICFVEREPNCHGERLGVFRAPSLLLMILDADPGDAADNVLMRPFRALVSHVAVHPASESFHGLFVGVAGANGDVFATLMPKIGS